MKKDFAVLDLIGEIDDKFVYEASRPWKKRKVMTEARKLKIAAAGIVLALLLGGAFTHQKEVRAAWKQFTSWIGQALGITKDVSDYTDNVGKTVTKDGISITVEEAAADRNDLWIAYLISTSDINAEEPILFTSVCINENIAQLEGTYNLPQEKAGQYRQISHYATDNREEIQDAADVSIKVWTAAPQDLEKLESLDGLNEYDFLLSVDLKALEAKTVDKKINKKIEISENRTLKLERFRINDFTSRIYGEGDFLEDGTYWLVGEDDMGNPVRYQKVASEETKQVFALDQMSGYTRISPKARSVTLQLYIDKAEPDQRVVKDTDTEDGYIEEEEFKSYEEGEDPMDYFVPLGEKITIRFR